VLRRLRTLTERECYARCYGAGDDAVRIVGKAARPGRATARMSGEELRRLFEQRLDAREPRAA
jgi:hypothetical protein